VECALKHRSSTGHHLHPSLPTRRSSDLTVTITYTPADGGEPEVHEVAEYGQDGGVAMGMFNYNDSIRDFARASFNYALDRGVPRSEEHTSELQSRFDLVCRLLHAKKEHH